MISTKRRRKESNINSEVSKDLNDIKCSIFTFVWYTLLIGIYIWIITENGGSIMASLFHQPKDAGYSFDFLYDIAPYERQQILLLFGILFYVVRLITAFIGLLHEEISLTEVIYCCCVKSIILLFLAILGSMNTSKIMLLDYVAVAIFSASTIARLSNDIFFQHRLLSDGSAVICELSLFIGASLMTNNIYFISFVLFITCCTTVSILEHYLDMKYSASFNKMNDQLQQFELEFNKTKVE